MPDKVRLAVVGLQFGAAFVPTYQNHSIADRSARLEDVLASDDHDTVHLLTPVSSHAGSGEVPRHGDSRQRQERLDLLRRIGEGTNTCDQLRQGEAWEKPVRFIDALSDGAPAQFHAMNLLSDSRQISSLPPHVFAQTPCRVSSGTVDPQTVTPPASGVGPGCMKRCISARRSWTNPWGYRQSMPV